MAEKLTIDWQSLPTDWLEQDRRRKQELQRAAYREKLRRKYLRQRRKELQRQPDGISDRSRTGE